MNLMKSFMILFALTLMLVGAGSISNVEYENDDVLAFSNGDGKENDKIPGQNSVDLFM